MAQVTNHNLNPLLDERLVSLLLAPVKSLPFLPRTKHLLERYGASTIADLYYFIDNDMLTFRGVGPTTVEEIEVVTQRYTRQLLDEYSQEDINIALARAQRSIDKEGIDKEWLSEERDESFLDLSLPVRITRSLKRGGIRTITDLVCASEESLRCIRNIGEKSLPQILDFRNRYLVALEGGPLAFSKANISSPRFDFDLPESIKKKLALLGIKKGEELNQYSSEQFIVEAGFSYPELLDIQQCLYARGMDFLNRWPDHALINECDYEYVKRLGVPLEKIDLSRLALPLNTEEILRQHLLIKSTDALARQSKVVLQAGLLQYNDNSLSLIERNLKSYFEWLPTQNDWETEVNGINPSPVYIIQLRATSLERILEYFLAVVPSERYKRILELRYGLDEGNRNTLQEIGEKFNITRERVRQLEKAAINKLYKPKNNGLVQALYFVLKEEMKRHGGIMSIEQIGAYLESFMEIGEVQLGGTISLLLSLEDTVFTEVIPNKLWGLKNALLDLIEPIQEQLVMILRVRYSSLPYLELKTELTNTPWYSCLQIQAPITDEFIRACMLTDDRFEELDDYWSLTKWKKSRIDEIVMALRRLGKPAHFSDITKTANELLPSQELISPKNCHAILQRKSDLFVWVGRGTYGLSEWGIKRSRFYVDIADEFIAQRGEPLRLVEIHAHVNRERQISVENIAFMLSTNHRFYRYPDDKFGLARWIADTVDEENNQSEQADSFFEDLRKRFFDDL